MKATISLWITTLMFFCTLGTLAAQAAPAPNTVSRQPVEVTGCLEQGPTAKEYLLKTSDGTTWGITETDMLMNNYVDHTVTISGDRMHPTAAERSAGGAQHFLRAFDLVVESGTCNK
jgi:hypothetical protein